ncbi:MAG: AtpZ/AtpI family protein [Anaerolineales bacterium]
MTQSPGSGKPSRALTNTQIAGLMAQSGCLVVVVILLAVAAGIWLDRELGTRPVFTLVLVMGSVPVTLFLLYRMATQAISAVPTAARPAKKVVDDDSDDA